MFDADSQNLGGRTLSISQVQLLADLTVSVDIRLGQLTLTGEQLIDLHTGQYLEIEVQSGQCVELIVSGERIACGRLVWDGNQTFVEITESEVEKSYAEEEPIEPNKATMEGA